MVSAREGQGRGERTEEWPVQAKQFSGEAKIDEYRAHMREARREADMDSASAVYREHVHRRQRPLERDQLFVELENLLISAGCDAKGLVGLRRGGTMSDYSSPGSLLGNHSRSS
jgi:hypothetical protein